LRAGGERVTVVDRLAGEITVAVDDFVLQRGDGTPAYNLAVVVDDAAAGVGEVVRGDDLLSSTPRQMLLARKLGLASPAYAHVPLVLAPDGSRLAKRHGAVTLADRAARGEDAAAVRSRLATSLGLAAPGEVVTMDALVKRLDPDHLPRRPWVFTADDL
jgi:glutamyl-tRNA synthetase